MKIYTSYFAREKVLRQNGIVPVSISLKSPKFFEGDEVKDLAPTYSILKIGREGDTAGYTKKFKALLDNLDKNEVIEKLKAISEKNGGMDVAICCYEKVTDFCHRHIVADWLNEDTDLKVVEFGAAHNYEGVMMVQRSYWE